MMLLFISIAATEAFSGVYAPQYHFLIKNPIRLMLFQFTVQTPEIPCTINSIFKKNYIKPTD